SREAMLAGGDSGPAIVPGDPDASLLIEAVRYGNPDYEMPPRGKLAAAEISILERWVAMGAPMPAPRPATKDTAPGTEFRWTEEDIELGRDHWAYRPVVAQAPPLNQDGEWARSDVDRFVLAGLEAQGRRPAPDADRSTWLRRVTFDLTGLPPTLAEQRAFEADTHAGAEERVVDRLLESPAFGERWGRHWLDVARYAESSGKEVNVAYPHAWRYRDWVISAFNEDIPYDRFVQMQLAGDLLPANSEHEEANNLVATGYLAIGSKSHATRGRNQFLLDVIDEQIDATTQGLLATTVACARCHDHKFDPIPQSDYYALAGVFASSETRFGAIQANQSRHASKLIELPAGARLPEGSPIPPGIHALSEQSLSRARAQVDAAQEVRSRIPGRGMRNRNRLSAEDQRVIQQGRQAAGRVEVAETLLARFDEAGRPTIDNFVCMGVVEGDPRNVPFLERGEIDQPRELVPRGFPRLLDPGDSKSISSGSGRLELAMWITDERHPLTARVWSNRIWQHLFGRGIVPTPDNFGLSGRPPSNGPLLDHLATRLRRLNWSTKDLLRELVLSRSYAVSSRPADDQARDLNLRDVDLLIHGVMPKRPLQAEAVRDSLLAVSGRLDPSPPIGSAAAFFEGPVPANLVGRVLDASMSSYEAHRSVYLPVMRGALVDDLTTFDFPDPEFVKGERDRTNVATQALFLMNDESVATSADRLAARLVAAERDFRGRMEMAYRLIFGRRPSSYEYRACRDFLQDIDDSIRADDARRLREETPQERRRRIRNRRRGGEATSSAPASPDPEVLGWSTLCQTLFQSSEFRILD
ncbi:MAG: PSD1 and planctomycete cytochrome C domain-containing protein, partial [Planctomycetota bacterium]|nr:PSD1 and planctomycete cytochrome C domain-containing protein [Planctomycetota bacterium]